MTAGDEQHNDDRDQQDVLNRAKLGHKFLTLSLEEGVGSGAGDDTRRVRTRLREQSHPVNAETLSEELHMSGHRPGRTP